MTKFKRASLTLLIGCATAALSACGADDIASPGEGVIVLPPAPTPSPSTPTPTEPGGELVTPAADCPTLSGPNQLTERNTITGPTGEYLVCALPARFTQTTQLPNTSGVVYLMDGRVDVGTDQGAASTGTNVTLGIDPGVVVMAAEGPSFLAVNRGNRINAVGTATRPIIFTARSNVNGTATDNSSQLWGGVVLLGRAPVTDCLAGGATPGTVDCERDTEGTSNALYGGAQPGDNSGSLRYVQIRYSGFILSNDRELQGLTPSGVGYNTTIDHVQVHNSSDDGIEVFGGRPNMKYLVLTGNEDDNLDTDVGYKGYIQFVLGIHRPGIGNGMVEADSNGNENAVPRQNTRLSNFTFISRGEAPDTGAAILLRGGTDYTLVNGVVVAPANVPCLRINSATTTQTAGDDEAGAPVINSVVFSGCNPQFLGSGGVATDAVAALFNAGTNNNANFTSTLTGTFINGTGEAAVPAFDAATLNNTTEQPASTPNRFETTAYIGAVRDANDTWYRNWTCNSSFAEFGSSTGSCTSLPTT